MAPYHDVCEVTVSSQGDFITEKMEHHSRKRALLLSKKARFPFEQKVVPLSPFLRVVSACDLRLYNEDCKL